MNMHDIKGNKLSTDPRNQLEKKIGELKGL